VMSEAPEPPSRGTLVPGWPRRPHASKVST
jgi:hypothetical protein